MDLPNATLRLFSGYPPEELARPEYRGFLLERLLEEGDRADLRWLCAEVGEAELRAFFRHHGESRLSARSRAFWRLLLGEPAAATPAGAASPFSSRSDLWPLS